MNDNGFDMFQTSGYVNARNRKRTLILDVHDTITTPSLPISSGSEFSIDLFEPLIIDKHSEIYLDNFTTYNSNIANGIDSAGYSLNINEFNIKSNVASTSGGDNMFNRILVPNDHNSHANNHGVVGHKSKKFNYICDINPQRISKLSGNITNLAGEPAFHGTSDGKYTYALIGIAVYTDWNTSLNPESIITSLSVSGTNILLNANSLMLSHSEQGGDIHFTSDTDISSANIDLIQSDGSTGTTTADDIILTVGGQAITITAGVNPDLKLIKGYGRFIAEFSIISRE